jgi:hypothetical protein
MSSLLFIVTDMIGVEIGQTNDLKVLDLAAWHGSLGETVARKIHHVPPDFANGALT